MKRILITALAAVMLLTSCRTAPPEETSSAAAAVEAGYLTGIYDTAEEAMADSVCTPILPLDPADPSAGYRYAHFSEQQLRIVTCLGGEETTVSTETADYPPIITMTESGVFTIERLHNPDATLLRQYAFTGELLREADILPFTPSDDPKFPIWPGMNSGAYTLPILETDSGYLLAWGNYVLTLDGEFGNPVTREFPSDIINLFRDDVTGSVWVYYINEGGILENPDTGTLMPLPDAEKLDRRVVIGVHDGLVYCMDRKSVYCMNPAEVIAGSSSPKELMSYENSLLLYSPYAITPVFSGDEVHLSIRALDESAFKCHLIYCTPAEDIPLSEITVLELVTAGRNPSLTKTVFAFNAAHRDCRILIDDYSRFNTDDDINAGLNRLRLDLETGILSPDLILTDSRTYHNIITSSPDLFLDLYTLDYSEAEYSPDDLWTAIRHAGEVNGELYAILPDFTMDGLAGLKKYTGDIDSWNLEEFLDWTETLADGEYIMDEYGQNSCHIVFGYDYQWLHFYEQGTFDDPLYTRYLNFINALPERGPKIQQKRSTIFNPDDLLLDYEKEDEFFDAGGENMYKNGTIKLAQCQDFNLRPFNSIARLICLMDILGADSVTDVNFMGYPSGKGRGFIIHANLDNLISICAKSEHPETAWKFAEYLLDQGAEETRNNHGSLRADALPSLRQPAVDYLKSMEGMEIFYDYTNDGLVTDPEQIEQRQQNRVPGKLYTVDSAVTELYTDLLDSELMTLADDTTLEFRNIVGQEESAMLNGEQTVQTTAEAVASRTAIYIAEKN